LNANAPPPATPATPATPANGNGRRATVERATTETRIKVSVDLDGRGRARVQTPLPFLSHMLHQIARHGLFDLEIEAEGDIEIDGHHTTEDIGIVLGQAVARALGDRKGIVRYGDATLPMDEALVTCALDLSGRPFFVWRVPLPKATLGSFEVELTPVFFEAFARSAGANLHLRMLEGENLHHIIEICFKAFARSLAAATRLDPRVLDVPSSKGSLGEP
jgi:imidazoleglycerol-phosphate dehydratase